MILNELDQREFSDLVEPYRHELQVHCYRMMGTVQDAEDMVQETFLRAWRRRETAEGRDTFRAWLYKIATNVCLDALKKRPYRVIPVTRQAASPVGESLPESAKELIWLEPYPDDLLGPADDTPEAYFSARENISLAFVAALHLLPPRQRAVLILRDVLDWEASEVAALLDMTVPSVKSALHRARATLANHNRASAEFDTLRVVDDEMQHHLDHFVHAWESADINALLSLLKNDAILSMPPLPTWYRGWDAIRSIISTTLFRDEAHLPSRLLPTAANRQPAYGLYRQAEAGGTYNAAGILVLTYHGDLIADITVFMTPDLVAYFGLPALLPA